MLPRFAGVVPMEAKLGQNPRDFGRLLVRELNPNPLANHFRQFKEFRRLIPQQREQVFRFQAAICAACLQVNLRQLLGVQLFGSALESRFLFF